MSRGDSRDQYSSCTKQKTIRRELQKSNIHYRTVIAKPLITENHSKKQKRWCDDNKTWTSYDWKYVIRPDESSFTLIPTSGRVYVGRTPKEADNPEGLVPTVEHGGRSVMIWAAISWYSAGRIIALNGRITASGYRDFLRNQVHPVVHMLFPNNDAIFQDDNSLMHSVRLGQS